TRHIQTGTPHNDTNLAPSTASTKLTNSSLAISYPQYRLVRDSGQTSSPSSAWFSSSSANARFSASIAANVNVTHRMLGATSIVGTAVGSRPKLNTVSTSAVNTTAERIAVRVRNSSSRSLRATTQASFSRSSTGDPYRLAVRVCHLRAVAPGPGSELHEAAAVLEGDIGRQL